MTYSATELKKLIQDDARICLSVSKSLTVDQAAQRIIDNAEFVTTLVPIIAERRQPFKERRQKDTVQSIYLRQRQRRAIQSVGERTDLPTRIVLDSAIPPIFEVGGPTHQIVAHVENLGGQSFVSAFTYNATNSHVSVDANGLVTAVSDGAVDVVLTSTTYPNLSVYNASFTVITPVSAVTQLIPSATSLQLNQGSSLPLSVIPKDANGNVVQGVTVTPSELGGTGDITISGYTGPEAHQISVLGVAAGSRGVRFTHAASGTTVDVPVTILAVGGVTDALGVNHPSQDPSFVTYQSVLWGSHTLSTTATLHPGTRYFKNGREGFDTAGGGGFRVIENDDGRTVPHEAAREVLYPGHGKRRAFGTINPGQIVGAAWCSAASKHIANMTSGGFGAGFAGRKFRKMYYHWEFELAPDLPAMGNFKLGFLNGWRSDANGTIANYYSPNFIIAMRPGSSGLDTTSMGNVAAGLQSCGDDRLYDPNRTLQPSSFNITGGGVCTTQNSSGGSAVTLIRGRIYRLEVEFRTSTGGVTIGQPVNDPLLSQGQATDGIRDGYIIYKLSYSLDGINYTNPVIVGYWPNLFTAGSPQATGFNSYMTAIQQYHQWAGSPIQTFTGLGRWTRNGNFDIISTAVVPYRVGSTIYNLPIGTVCNLPAKTLAANRWGAAVLSADAAGVVTATWASSDYGSAGGARDAMPDIPNNQGEVGFVQIQASASGWTEGTDALPGGVGGTPAAAANYVFRTGIISYLTHWAVGEEEF